MKKTLYILKDAPNQEVPSLMPSQSGSGDGISVVLIQDGVKHKALPFARVFALSDDTVAGKGAVVFPPVSYAEFLKMIFDADTVAVL